MPESTQLENVVKEWGIIHTVPKIRFLKLAGEVSNQRKSPRDISDDYLSIVGDAHVRSERRELADSLLAKFVLCDVWLSQSSRSPRSFHPIPQWQPLTGEPFAGKPLAGFGESGGPNQWVVSNPIVGQANGDTLDTLTVPVFRQAVFPFLPVPLQNPGRLDVDPLQHHFQFFDIRTDFKRFGSADKFFRDKVV